LTAASHERTPPEQRGTPDELAYQRMASRMVVRLSGGGIADG
jgi:hypothetical protein